MRHPILLALAAQSAVDVLDEVVSLFDRAVSGREAAARQRLDEQLAERARLGEDRQALLDDILAVVLDPAISGLFAAGFDAFLLGERRVFRVPHHRLGRVA